MVPAMVLAETCYLIDRTLGPIAEGAFLDSVGTGLDCTFQLVELVDSDLRRMAALVRQYADLRLGRTDASVIAICERLGIFTVATVNLRDFATVRPRRIPAFVTVPGLGLLSGPSKTPNMRFEVARRGRDSLAGTMNWPCWPDCWTRPGRRGR
jgi:predicted nucleic acid-binding protein